MGEGRGQRQGRGGVGGCGGGRALTARAERRESFTIRTSLSRWKKYCRLSEPPLTSMEKAIKAYGIAHATS